MGKFKIIADGTHLGVKIFTPSGEDITKFIKGYRLEHGAGGVPTLSLEMFADSVEGEISVDENCIKQEITIIECQPIKYPDGGFFGSKG